jgi:hypothetical protein
VITVPAFIRAPKLVAQLDVAGALPFVPTVLPGSRICALLSVQDPTFYRHQGIGLLDGAPGHTTVTQALCKRLYFKEFSPGLPRLGKIKLMIIAWAFDHRIPKDTQLRLFLNLAYFGSLDGKKSTASLSLRTRSSEKTCRAFPSTSTWRFSRCSALPTRTTCFVTHRRMPHGFATFKSSWNEHAPQSASSKNTTNHASAVPQKVRAAERGP